MTDRHSYEQISRLLRADFDEGKLYWLPRSREMFSSQFSFQMWNGRYSGKEAFTADSHGYRIGAIHDRLYRAHRVLWLLHTGKWPIEQLDHINGCRHDNRLANLREASNAENAKNQRVRPGNTSSVQGVSWHKQVGKWRAYITVEGRHKALGCFDEFDAAVERRKLGEKEHGYHQNHGRRV